MGAVFLASAPCIATGLHGAAPLCYLQAKGDQFLRQESRRW